MFTSFVLRLMDSASIGRTTIVISDVMPLLVVPEMITVPGDNAVTCPKSFTVARLTLLVAHSMLRAVVFSGSNSTCTVCVVFTFIESRPISNEICVG